MTFNEEKITDNRMDQILSKIKNKDKEGLKELFSKKALDDADDMDNGIDYLFDLFQEDVKSCKRDFWSSDESIEHGKNC